ncbi:MAG: aminodeoxychorismate synthase component I, partial [Micromonosporaceae bacterium]
MAFWLDSSRTGPGMGRFSFLGAPDGPLSHVQTYDVTRREVSVRTAAGTTRHQTTMFDFTQRTLARGVARPSLPFDFAGGYVGYVGYEVKADCGGDAAHRSPHPDATLVFTDRFIAFDHEERRVYLFALIDDTVLGAGVAEAEAWFDRVEVAVAAVPPPAEPALETTPPAEPDLGTTPPAAAPQPVADRASYRDDIAACLDELAAGESYEICLTSRVRSHPLRVA